jgi:hypothetical protein
MLEISTTEDDILYLEEPVLYFYLSNGANDRGAIFSRLVLGRSIEDAWLRDNPHLRFVVGNIPLSGSTLITQERPILLEVPSGGRLSDVSLKLVNRSAHDVRIDISLPTGETCDTTADGTEIMLVANTSGWFPILVPDGSLGNRACVITRTGPVGKVTLDGIRVGGEGRFNWPWNSGLRAYKLRGAVKGRALSFDLNAIIPWLKRDFRMIDDSGASFLAEILPPAGR